MQEQDYEAMPEDFKELFEESKPEALEDLAGRLGGKTQLRLLRRREEARLSATATEMAKHFGR